MAGLEIAYLKLNLNNLEELLRYSLRLAKPQSGAERVDAWPAHPSVWHLEFRDAAGLICSVSGQPAH